MTIQEAQDKVDEYIRNIGVRYFSELTNLAILMEEVGELSRHFSRKFGDQSYKNGENPDDFKKEFGDILFVLICLANQTGVSLTEVLESTLNKNSNRDKDRHKNNPKLQ
ncbi:MAG: nucleotide pyrophosphohydrolase [Leptospiraceae bacterium]|nr:nucleotide pyrophosphohydrolase [Leptospiraceae bacterium]MCZ8346109.1 nucleotide pyrophosphohydrolase [Leptospiraceae bacterium]